MSKFEELRRLAVKKSRTFRECRQEIVQFASELVNGLRGYLESTPRSLNCIEVDRQHRAVGEPSPLPEPCFCYDTFWYFEVVFEFPFLEQPIEGFPAALTTAILVGVKKAGDEFLVRLPGKDFRMRDAQQGGEFYEYIFASLKEDLQIPWTEPSKRLGFTIPDEPMAQD